MTETAAPADKPHKLDDLMIAMDVVDTIRHRDDLVRRELGDEAREAEMIERLREIYRQQGIQVSDAALAAGVKALKESRFTYTPKPPSLKRTLFEMWVGRKRYGLFASAAAALVLSTCTYEYLYVTRPAQVAEEQLRVETTETLPRNIRQLHADILAASSDATARQRADQLRADGDKAIREKDRAGMQRVAGDLERLNQQLLSEYTLTIVSRPGETTGVWRRPPRNSTQRNYYIIVEPIAPNGRKLSVPVLNEEDGQTSTVDKFGVRVPQSVFDAVAADKKDDGIVQRNRFGVKRRGTLNTEYLMPYEGGTITKW